MLNETWLTGATLLGVLGLMFKMNRDGEQKRGRIFQRLDENKKAAEEKFTLTQVCEERHKRIDETLIRIDKNIDFLVRKNGGNST